MLQQIRGYRTKRSYRVPIYDWIVIGGGVAGCRLSHHLTQKGNSVLLLEKARGLGGRLCHRRTEYGRYLHGVQYISIRSQRLYQILEPYILHTEDVRLHASMQSYDVKTGAWDDSFSDGSHHRYVVYPNTSVFCADWSKDATVHLQEQVQQLHFHEKEDLWIVETAREKYHARHLASTVPWPQMQAILPAQMQAHCAQGRNAVYHPSASCILRFTEDWKTTRDFQGCFLRNSPISFLARQDHGDLASWVAVLEHAWVQLHWKLPIEQVQEEIIGALGQLHMGTVPTVAYIDVHWWKYALLQGKYDSPMWYEQWKLLITGEGYHSQYRGVEGAVLAVDEWADTLDT